MKYSFEITRMELQPNEFGKNDIVVKQVKVLDENGKYVKFAKLNEALLKAMQDAGTVKVRNTED